MDDALSLGHIHPHLSPDAIYLEHHRLDTREYRTKGESQGS
jgi:hypothetical protein